MPSNTFAKGFLSFTKGVIKDLGGFQNPTHFKDQKYSDIKSSLSRGQLFEDAEFPAQMSSLFYQNQSISPSAIEWKRPHELCNEPELVKGGTSRHDVNQGQLGNCWFVAACSVLAEFPKLRDVVIPDLQNQDFSNNYQGIFRFRFFRCGEWVDVVIDDRLPTRNGQLLFIKSPDQEEYWSALLEKAYAKLAGNYEALDGGNLTDALVDFTGGVAETFDFEGNSKYQVDVEAREILFNTLKKELKWDSLMCAAITVKSRDDMEAVTNAGLVKGHAYGVTSVANVKVQDAPGLFTRNYQGMQKVNLIRLRNPWGKVEWKGPFSDGSPEWAAVPESQKEKLGLSFSEDGEFWIPFELFVEHFSMMSVCHIMYGSVLGSITAGLAPNWSETMFRGDWKVPDLAGGCINNRESFLRNPQYRFDVIKDHSNVIICLEQPDTRSERSKGGKSAEYLAIGFQVLKVEENRKTRVHIVKDPVDSSTYINSRSVMISKLLKQGRYVIVPTTFNPNVEGEFLLRVYTDGIQNNAQELTEDVPVKSGGLFGLFCSSKTPKEVADVAYVTVRKGQGLLKNGEASADPYVLVKCEGKEVKTPVVYDSPDPEWNTSAMFFRKNPNSTIELEVYNWNRLVKDDFMGAASFDAPKAQNNRVFVKNLPLKSKDNKDMPGEITIEVASYDDVRAI